MKTKNIFIALALYTVLTPLLFLGEGLGERCFAQGNMISIISKVPADITICGASKTFTVSINNPSPFLLTSVTLTVNMPSGMIYQKASVTGGTDFNTATANVPVFSLKDIPTLTTRTITFSASAGCDIMTYLANGNIPNINIRVGYTANTTIKTYDTHTTLSYLVKQPNLSITAVSNQSYSGNVGDTYTRCITIVNGGVGELSQFQLTDTHGNGVKINNVSTGSLSTSGTTETIVLSASEFSAIGNKNNLFESGEQITVCETVNITNCASVASSFEASWGCNKVSCQSSFSSANIVFPNLVPNLTVTAIPSQGTCYGITIANKQQLKIVNSGKGEAINVKLDIFNSDGVAEHVWQRSSIDSKSFTVQYGAATPVSITVDSTKSNHPIYQYACLPANANSRVYLTIPSVKSGETVYLSWNIYNCCESCSKPVHIDVNGWAYQGSYENICKSYYVVPLTQGRYFNRIDGYLSNNSSPASLVSGQTGTFNFMFSTYDNWYTSANSNSWKFVYTLPACLSYAGNFRILHVKGVSVWNPSSVTTSGNTVTAIFKGNPPWSLAQAQVIADFKANCSGCTGGKDTVLLTASYISNASCTCEIGVSCAGTSIDIICPVTCEGMNVSSFDVKRTNYGLPDNNDDGLADASGTLNFSKIRKDRTMFGDTVTAAIAGVIKTSTANPTWNYCYASNTMTNGDHLNFLDAELKIYRGSSVYTCKINNPAITTTGTTRSFSYDLSASVLIANGCVSAGFVYSNNDSVVFNPRYKITVNTQLEILQCFVTESFYVSNVSKPANGDKYSCNDFQGNFSIIGYYFDSWGPDGYTVNTCNTIKIQQNYYFGLGPCCNGFAGVNYFPYEYRNWTHINTLSVKVPAGYQFISARFQEERTAGTQVTKTSPWVSIAPANASSDSLAFLVEKYFQGYGGTIPLSDGGYYGTLEVTLAPSCAVVQNIASAIKYDWIYGVSNYYTGSNTPPTRSVNNQDFLTYQGPSLLLQSALPNIMASDKQVTYDISLSNTTSIDASNVWLSAPKISGVTVVQVVDANTGVSVSLTGNIYKLGTLAANAVRKFRVIATYTSCQQDSIIMHTGWNCNAGYPSDIASYPCSTKQLKLKLIPQIPTLVANVTNPPATVSLCDTAGYVVEGANIQTGTAYSVKLRVVLPEGVSVVQGTSLLSYPITKPYTSISEPTLISGTTYEWNVSSLNTQIANNGLKGILNVDSNSVRIKFKVRTNCNYTSGSMISFSFNGQSACGLTTGQEVTLSSQLGITGATEPYFTEIKLISSYISPCANNSTMKVVIRNNGPTTFGSKDSVVIQLPEDISYILSSFKGFHNAPADTNPAQSVLNNHVNLRWSLPAGIAAGDSVVFSFDFKGDQKQLSCGINEFNAKTITPKSIFCTLTGNNCGIHVITGDTTLPMYIYQAFLLLRSANANATPNPPSGETVALNFDITNYGETILSGNNSIISYYYDANGDSILSQGDVLLGKDTVTSQIGTNATVKHAAILNAPAGKACSIIAVMDTSLNSCACGSTQTFIKIPLHSAKDDTTLCLDKATSLILGYPPVTGYTYSWTPPTGLNNTSTANPQLTLPVPTGGADTMLYVVTTNRTACVSIDTIQVILGALPIADAGEPQAICSGNSVTLKTAGGDFYLWSNGETTSSIIVSPSLTTTYTVTVSNKLCSSTDSVTVTINPSPIAKFTASPDEGDAPLEVSFLNASTNASSYQWIFGEDAAISTETNPVYTYSKETKDYLVTLKAFDSSGRCSDTATKIIKVMLFSTLWIPNIFTPNNNGLNEFFRVVSFNITEFNALIFNRWGELIYEWDGAEGGWDGTYKGKQCPDGVYVYLIKAKGIDKVLYNKAGHFTLLR